MKHKNKQYRQGDVFIEQVATIPKTAIIQKPGKIVLAHGEVTGHDHTIDEDSADWWKDDGAQYLHVFNSATVVHQEHNSITLPPGRYKVVIQREYHPERIRNVAD